MRILVVDDEPLARRRLQLLLRDVAPDAISVVLTAGVEPGLAALEKETFDVILLDVRMRDGTGFDLLRRLPDGVMPIIIFVTAFGDTAISAFEAAATDYLLKPVVPARLRSALDRAQATLRGRTAEEALARLELPSIPAPEVPPSAPGENEFWLRKSAGGFVRLDVRHIDYAVVEDDYVRIHVADRSYLLRGSIRSLLSRIDSADFVQTHRSTLVHVARIVAVEQAGVNRSAVVLDSGQRLPMGRVYGRTIQRAIRQRRIG